MEALMLLSVAWLAMLLSEFICWSLVSVIRWAPHFAAGALVACIAHTCGATGLQAVELGIGASVLSCGVSRCRVAF